MYQIETKVKGRWILVVKDTYDSFKQAEYFQGLLSDTPWQTRIVKRG